MKLFYFLPAVLVLAGCGRSPEVSANSPAPKLPPSERGLIRVAPDSPQLSRIRVAPVEMRSFPSDEVLAPGRVEANPNRITRVVMPVPGRVHAVLVRLGDSVESGQPLLSIDSPEAGAALAAFRQAQAQIRQTRASLGKSEKDLARLRDLYEHRAAALKDVQNAENELAQAQAALEQSEASADEAQHRLDLLGLKPGASSQEVVVRAPIPGKVLEIAVVPGEYRNDTNTPLLTVADLRTVWIAAEVPESSIRHVARGEYLEVQLAAFPGETFRGRVARIADVVDPQTRTVKVQAEMANPGGRLRPEMYGQIRHSHGAQMLPAIPAGALLEGDRRIVMVEAGPGAFRRTAVELGARQGEYLPVMAGLHAGDRVVVDGVMLLKGD